MDIKKILAAVLMAFAVYACSEGGQSDSSGSQAGEKLSDENSREGAVVETMNSGGYTYVKLDAGGREIWVAGPQTAVEVGQKVGFAEGMLMRDYYSKTLERTFPEIYFVAQIAGGSGPGSSADLGQAHGNYTQGGAEPDQFDVSGISKPEGGFTVEQIFAGKENLVGNEVRIRAKIVKANYGILNANWYHLRDGTGGEGQNDLTVTSQAKAGIGDVVLVQGVLSANKDFGAGYKYPLIIENAIVTAE